jgi:hypothetical protein
MRPLVLALAMLAPLPAAAADEFVERAEALMDEAEYAKAQRVIAKGLAREVLTMDARRRLYMLEGTCWVSLGRSGQARSSFAKLLTVQPTFKLPAGQPPKVREQFDRVRQEMLASGDLQSDFQVQHTPLDNLAPGRDADVRLGFSNADRAGDIERVVLYVRRLGTSEFASVDGIRADDGATFVARVPTFLLPEEAETYAMEYYLDALGSDGERLAGAGKAELPLGFLVVSRAELQQEEDAVEEGLPIVPIGIGVGIAVGLVVAAGAAVGAFFLLSPKTGTATVVVTQESP